MQRVFAGLAAFLITLSAAAAVPQPAQGYTKNEQSQAPATGKKSLLTSIMQALTPAPSVPDQPIDSLSGELQNHDPSVGALAGSAGVSGGSASYEVPITLPPGRNGMQPSVSLNYSSRGGDGIAGMGWSLSAVSSIHRCPPTVEQDGSVRAVDFSNNDRLCLDGQRLIPAKDANGVIGAYGAANTAYSTELDSFARINQLGGDLTSAATYFKVEYKSGEIAWYGANSTAASKGRVIPGGKSAPLTWLLTRRQDRLTNSVLYTYDSTDAATGAYGQGEILLQKIAYTGQAATAGDREVRFTYEVRPDTDQSSSYLSGGLTQQTRRLALIGTWVNNVAVREYRLRYDAVSAHTERSLLRGIKDCGYPDAGGAAACKIESKFTWQEAAPAPPEASFGRLDLESIFNSDAILGVYPQSDFDGDGVRELLVIVSDNTAPSYQRSYLVSLNADRTPRGAVDATAMLGTQSGGLTARPAPDMNLDGRADIYGIQSGTNKLTVTTWNNSTTAWVPSAFTTYVTNLVIPTGYSDLRVADMNGDGRPDVVVAGDGASPTQRVQVYLGVLGTYPQIPKFNTTPAADVAQPYDTITTQIGPHPQYYRISRIEDFDGDGLSDVVLDRQFYGDLEDVNVLKIWFSRVNNGSYSLGGAGNQFDNFASIGGSWPLGRDEIHRSGYNQWLDVNGDGLTDFVSPIRQADGLGYWSVRLNTGGKLGPRIATTSRRGLETCIDRGTGSTCADRWSPVYAPQFGNGDTDTDGRRELMVPRAWAARICVVQSVLNAQKEPIDHYYCPENPATGTLEAKPSWMMADEKFNGMYSNPASPFGGVFDPSAYYMDSLRFVQTGASSFRVEVNATDVISGGHNSRMDVYGDGLEDTVAKLGYAYPASTAMPTKRGVVFQGSPGSLPNGQAVSALAGPSSARFYLSQNLGTSQELEDKRAPNMPDYISAVTDGLGKQTLWSYAPLSSKDGRAAGETPLYTLPQDPAQRYIDEHHSYFTSSMPVVTHMDESDGLGGYNTTSYGYAEAMVNTQGRGFQGFRTIIEEDEANQLRTTSVFIQKFPLTSRVSRVTVSSMSRPDVQAPIKIEIYNWRCNLANATDTTACTAGSNPATVRFPFLYNKWTYSYDVATAENPAGGVPPEVSLVQEYNVDDPNCDGNYATASGYDSYGNLTASAVVTFDLGDNSPSQRRFIGAQRVCTKNTYAAADTVNWWLDKQTQQVTTTAITYNVLNHQLPSGVSNPTQTVTTNYTWNGNRTPATESVQPGIVNQRRVTAYTYPATNNYGLPSKVTVTATDDVNGSREASTTYSADGYFPSVVTDALGHQTATTVRARDGQPSLSVDANGLRTLIQYDPFGLAVKTQFHGATDSEIRAPDKNVAVIRCWSVCWPDASALYQTSEVQDGTPTKYVTYDALSRPLVTGQRQLDGSLSFSRVQYNTRGLTDKQSEPYKSGATPVWTQFTGYDSLGRVTRKVVPKQLNDGRGDLVTTYAYAGRNTYIHVCGSADAGSAGCLDLSRSTDSLGRYMETVDALGGLTQFWYDATGNALALVDANGTVTRASYNAIGQRTQVQDPNQGTSNFSYNALGELLSQTDARNVVNTFAYDKLGRKTRHASANLDVTGDGSIDPIVDTWTYDPLNAVGALAQSKRTVDGITERQTDVSYDLMARPVQSDIQQFAGPGDTRTYTSNTQYDSKYGRPKAQTYATGDTVRLVYGKYGHLTSTSDAVTGAVYRTLNATNERGQPVSETLGAVTRSYSYEATTGQVRQINSKLGTASLRTLDYRYDVFGNLSVQMLSPLASEAFTYDKLHRMTQSVRSGWASGTVTYGYDAVGNFKYKSDFSTAAANAYGYSGSCGGGPNAVKSVITSTGTRSYCYDASGNMTSDSAGALMKYDEANHPWLTTRGVASDIIHYGPNGERTRQSGSDGTRLVIDNMEVDLSNGQTKLYLGNDVVITKTPGGVAGDPGKVEYLLTDRLGSVDAVADAAGAITQTRGYDAFGAPRLGDWNDASPPRLQDVSTTRKGFTEHEHLNAIELIHMNGRVYDYRLGRFLSVDPFIQAPLNSQSLNPYSYILNNPLSGTDPTGYASATLAEGGNTDGHNRKEGKEIAKEVSKQKGGLRDTRSISFKAPGSGAFMVGALSNTGQQQLLQEAQDNGATKAVGTTGADGRGENNNIKNGRSSDLAAASVTAPSADASDVETADSNATSHDDVVLSPEDIDRVLAVVPNLGGADRPTESYLSIDVNGNASGRSTRGCDNQQCSPTLDISSMKVFAHRHVLSIPSSEDMAGIRQAKIASLVREFPGPGDHKLVEEHGIVVIGYTPKSVVWALEIRDHQFTVKILQGGTPEWRDAISTEYRKGSDGGYYNKVIQSRGLQ